MSRPLHISAQESKRPSAFFSRRLPVLVLLVLLALGTYARLRHTGDVALGMDESWRIVSLLEADSLVHQMFTGMNRTDPPLFNLFLYILGQLYNVEFMLRLVSIIPGILAIPLAYLVARNLFSNRWLAVLASFLTAFSFDLMVYSKELKPFSLCAFTHLCILYGYLKYRKNITTRTTIAFTALLALSIPLSLHSPFAFPGVYLALFAGVFLSGTPKQKKLVLLSCVALLVFAALCFFLLVGGVSDEGHLTFMKDYWVDFFCPTESLGGMLAWLTPRYAEHYSDLAFSNRLAPRFIGDHLDLIYPLMALLGFLALLLRNRRRFVEAACLFLMPLLVMAMFSMLHQWPFGQLRMNIFVFFYILFPPLYFLDELGRISVRKFRLAPLLPLAACGLICIQFPADFKAFAHSRAPGSWQSGAEGLEHILDIYTGGPQIPLVCNHLGQAQFNYYSLYHRYLSPRYSKQAGLFAPRGMLARNSSFYLRGAMLRLCQESRQAAIYLTHLLGPETMMFNNEYCVPHDLWEGLSTISGLITSEIYDAARDRQQVFIREHFSGTSNEWEEVYISPLLKIEDAGPGTLVVFNLDLDYNTDAKRIRLTFLDENGSPDNFDRPVADYKNPVEEDHLETAACFRLIAPVKYVRMSISIRGCYDFTVSNLNWFAANEATWPAPAEPFQIVEDMCEQIQLVRRIRSVDNFWENRFDSFGWTKGNAVIELEAMDIDPSERVLMLETYGWMDPEIWDEIMGSGLKVYLNGNRRAPLINFSGAEEFKYYFHIPDDVQTVTSVNIRSGTFVPQERGINDDDRAVGINLKSIGFPRIVHEREGARDIQ